MKELSINKQIKAYLDGESQGDTPYTLESVGEVRVIDGCIHVPAIIGFVEDTTTVMIRISDTGVEIVTSS